tara:strand:+ start:927 stop:1337 length:411 start_codon:yes stop_codon:yes gene_type:complete
MKGFIYKITSPSTDKIYIGSTIIPLQQRFSIHLSKTKYGINNCNSKLIIALGNAVIECLEEVEYEDEDTLRLKEGECIRQHWDSCVNRMIPGRTQREYYEEHKHSLRREKIACVKCSKMISKCNMNRHLRESCKSI